MKPARKYPGFFITLEGGEGVGKSSQMKLLEEKLRRCDHHLVLTREPGGSPGAEAVRHVLLSGAAEKMGAEMEALLFSAARSDHVETIIRPALSMGSIVVSDRFFDSTRVYQGVTGDVDMQYLKQLEDVACEGAKPNVTYIIDMDPEEGLSRVQGRLKKDEQPDRFEKETMALQKKRREGFLKIAEEEPDRCIVIDGSGTPETVFERIWDDLQPRLEKHFDDFCLDVRKRAEKSKTPQTAEMAK